MYIYLAGAIIGGEYLDKCMAWRKQIREHYENYKGQPYKDLYFLDPLNSGETGTITEDGLKSSLSPETIVAKDRLSVTKADIIIANLDKFGTNHFLLGTISEIVWASEMRKPVIVISNEIKYTEHPFMRSFASAIVPDIETLLEKKIINTFYKSVVNAIY